MSERLRIILTAIWVLVFLVLLKLIPLANNELEFYRLASAAAAKSHAYTSPGPSPQFPFSVIMACGVGVLLFTSAGVLVRAWTRRRAEVHK